MPYVSHSALKEPSVKIFSKSDWTTEMSHFPSVSSWRIARNARRFAAPQSFVFDEKTETKPDASSIKA